LTPPAVLRANASHEKPHGGAHNKEENMRLISKADLQRRTNRELAGLKEEFRKEIGNCEQQRRKAHAAQANIRTVQAQRRIMRPNL
jgi:hypothetical protein